MPSLFDLSGKTAIITGSTKGIGEAIARRMAEHGAQVTVSSRKAEACDKIAASINASHPGQAIAVPCNISDKAQLQNLVDKSLAHWGKIDVLVCNAAINPYFGPSSDIPDEAFDRVMATNIRSNHWLCQMTLPHMQKQKDGVIIIISSIAGLRGTPILGAYAISKAADMQIARNLATEYGGDNIRVNAIAPGLIKTYFSQALWSNPEILKQSTERSFLQRIGEPDEIAALAVFLAGPGGAFTTGQTITVDGGGAL